MSPNPETGLGRLRGSDGFTLVETLVAFSVLAMLLSVLFRGVVQMRAGSNAFDAHTHDALVARAVFDDILAGRDLPPGRYAGQREGRHWTVTARPIDISAQLTASPQRDGTKTNLGTQASPLGSAPHWAPQTVIVQVETTGRRIEVETIRLVRGE